MSKNAKSAMIKTPVKDIANSWFTRRPEPPQLLITLRRQFLTRPPRMTKMKALRSNRIGPEQTSTSSETQNEQTETEQRQQQLFVSEGQGEFFEHAKHQRQQPQLTTQLPSFIDECTVEGPESLRSESIAAYMIEKQERKAFTNAFVTEIGDLKSSISLRELLDVIVCAGKDSTFEELSLIWPFDSEKELGLWDQAGDDTF
ncbi:hypothetical protein M3Y97_01064100 [Aphelenchoides bicaudatus]|nr:hypothetical protein M3Y97_01064100 [Aphelenchoides bicaudatus]